MYMYITCTCVIHVYTCIIHVHYYNLQILEASRLSNQREVMLRKKILVNADVICCTLSTSGRGELQSWFVIYLDVKFHNINVLFLI